MFYCPKCQTTYDDAVQRFCLNDGRRLIRALSDEKPLTQTNDVFTNFINRKTEIETDKFAAAPRFSRARFRRDQDDDDADFLPPFESEIFEVNLPEQPDKSIESAFEILPALESDDDLFNGTSALIEERAKAETEIEAAPEIEPEIEAKPEKSPEIETPPEELVQIEPPPANESVPEIEEANESEPEIEEKSAAAEVEPRLIAPREIPESEALLGDRTINPAGRKALSRENPAVLLDQTIKGRYLIVAQIGEDESGIVYLAEDKIVPDKKVVVRVLLDEDANNSFAGKIFAEERVSLSHINHPNIAGVIDSGELLEGKPFIINEFVEGKSIEELLQNNERFDVERVARIVRQASDGLSEAHQSGVLHRRLKPANIVLTVNEKGAEQVKLINFGAAKDKLNQANLPYKSPEQIEGKLANVTSDEYALAVIAFQMLTGKMPFKSGSTGKILKARREGLKMRATNLRLDLPASTNQILKKAMAFDASERYPKARDFGEAFYNAVCADADLKAEKSDLLEKASESPILMPSTPLIIESKPVIDEAAQTEPTKSSEEEFAPQDTNRTAPQSNRALLAVLGAAILILGVWGVWSLFINRPNEAKQNVQNVPPTANTAVQTTVNSPPTAANNLPTTETASNNLPANEAIAAALPARSITPPPNTNYFQNGKENLKNEASKNYLGFSLYYPKDWKTNQTNGGNAETKTRGTFLDISKNAGSGTPIEQMIVSYYDSSGAFKTDAENFAKQVLETNRTLSKIIPNYEMVSEGETTINNGWQCYELKFKGTGTTPAGEKITLWGKRLFVPAAMSGVKNGYMITMLATSLAKDIKSVEDVGLKGDLPKILYTFEPNQTF